MTETALPNRTVEERGLEEAIARAIGADTEAEPATPDDFLSLVIRVERADRATKRMLTDAVSAARGAGCTWEAIGETLGMTRQAAQKRFRADADAEHGALDPDQRVIGPVTAFNELAELNLAGRYGWSSVSFGALHHVVAHSDTQWEHARVSMLGGRAKRLQAQGWQVIGSEFPFTYLKRDLGDPAVPEPTS